MSMLGMGMSHAMALGLEEAKAIKITVQNKITENNQVGPWPRPPPPPPRAPVAATGKAAGNLVEEAADGRRGRGTRRRQKWKMDFK